MIVSRIAAHAADIAKGIKGASDWDLKMARARKNLDWEEQMKLAIDPELAIKKRTNRNLSDEKACSMCGKYCAVDIINKYFDKPVAYCND